MTSSILDRVIRVIVAADPVPKVRAGNTMCFRLVKPEAGSHPSFTENSRMSINPCQKFGIETPTKASTILTWSNIVYCFVADMIPIGIPIDTATKTPMDASFKVAGNLAIISFATGRFVA